MNNTISLGTQDYRIRFKTQGAKQDNQVQVDISCISVLLLKGLWQSGGGILCIFPVPRQLLPGVGAGSFKQGHPFGPGGFQFRGNIFKVIVSREL